MDVSVAALLARYGPLQTVYQYDAVGSNEEHKQTWCLVEYHHLESARRLLESCTFYPRADRWPSYSRMLWVPKELTRSRPAPADKSHLPQVHLVTHQEFDTQELQHCHSVRQQMELLYGSTKMTEFDTRVHYLLAASLEVSLSNAVHLFHSARLFPYGSCVNGFGRKGCDLDVVLLQDMEYHKKFSMSDPTLCFTTAEVSGDRERQQGAAHMTASIVRQLANFSNTTCIPHARIPIVKTRHSSTQLDVDISFYSRLSILMSEILWTLGELDPNVRPLVFTIKHWAKCQEITHKTPGRYVSNFCLVFMVISFLQRQQVLPPVRKLAADGHLYGNRGANQVRPVHEVPHRPRVESLESLLTSFFLEYSRFPFDTQGICTWTGHPINKPSQDEALYIKNPIEVDHNIGKIVSQLELDKFQAHCWIAYEKLQNTDKSHRNFGLLALFESEVGNERIGEVIKEHEAASTATDIHSQTRGSIDVAQLFSENSDTKERISTGNVVQQAMNTASMSSEAVGSVSSNSGSSDRVEPEKSDSVVAT